MQTLAQIRALLAQRGMAPRKSLGQNFLIDQNLITKLIDAADPAPGELVLEVGPGTGTLTEALLDRNADVLACELDRGLAGLLRDTLVPRGLTLVEGDCLERKRALNPALVEAIAGRPFVLVANLPYAAATPLVHTLLAQHPACRGLYATVQLEVADRLAASPGTKAYGALSVVAQALAEPELIAKLPPACFWPRPEVTSAMVALPRRAAPLTDDPAGLAEFCQRAFASRRKQLGAVLGRDRDWPGGIEPTMRAEALSVPQMIALHESERDRDGGNSARSNCSVLRQL